MPARKVSVIIPVYNTEPYLAECLDSVLTQSLEDIEVICVDDGSTDGSLMIMEEYARRDERLSVLNAGGRGVGFARNLALARASGEYVAFVDSDDHIHRDMLQQMYDLAVSDSTDVAICMIEQFNDSPGELFAPCKWDKNFPTALDDWAFTWIDITDVLFSVRFVCTNKIYRRKFLLDNDVKFPVGIYFEDMIFTYKALFSAGRMRFIRKHFYFNRKQRPGAITHTQGGGMVDLITAFNELEALLGSNPEFSVLEERFAAFKFRYLILFLSRNDAIHIEAYYNEVKGYVVDNPTLSENRYLNKKQSLLIERISRSDFIEIVMHGYWETQKSSSRSSREKRKLRQRLTKKSSESAGLKEDLARLQKKFAALQEENRLLHEVCRKEPKKRERAGQRWRLAQIKKAAKKAAPAFVKEGISRFMFMLTNDPIWGIRLARLSQKRKKNDRAVAVLLASYSAVGRSRREQILKQKQQLQYNIQKGLFDLQANEVEDPLFCCSVLKGERVDTNKVGSFKAYFRSRGLRIEGSVKRSATDVAGALPEAVEIKLDGLCIRRINIKFKGKRASYKITIRREALEHFPARGELRVSTSQGAPLLMKRSDHACLGVPFGSGRIHEMLRDKGPIDKKGYLPLSPSEAEDRRGEYLRLYDRARDAFDDIVGRPLFLMYGTLLGLCRDGDFITGDDDFDVAYFSEKQDPFSVKIEAIGIMIKLIEAGFMITLNHKGKPFRLWDPNGTAELHLDTTPVWYQDGRIWCCPFACIPLTPDDFRMTRTTDFRGVKAHIPAYPEKFFRTYYGEMWQKPDPSYSKSRGELPPEVRENLNALWLTSTEMAALKDTVERMRQERSAAGNFYASRLQDLYPLKDYRTMCGL